MKKYIPHPFACVFQFITFFVVAAPLIPIVLKTDGLLMGALITVVGLLWAAKGFLSSITKAFMYLFWNSAATTRPCGR